MEHHSLEENTENEKMTVEERSTEFYLTLTRWRTVDWKYEDTRYKTKPATFSISVWGSRHNECYLEILSMIYKVPT